MHKYILAAALWLGTAVGAVAQEAPACPTAEEFVKRVETSEFYAGRMDFTAAEAVRGAESVPINGFPKAENIKQALAVVRVDTVLILVIWETDGTCGNVVLPPEMAVKFLNGVSGRDA